MVINDVAGERVYRVWDILQRKFMGQNFMSGLRIFKENETKTIFIIYYFNC